MSSYIRNITTALTGANTSDVWKLASKLESDMLKEGKSYTIDQIFADAKAVLAKSKVA